ncbi:BrnT family toxin [Marivita hallyeonensis]|uniref:Uncharacterized protein n=1 Tax=Marivita hallyeonensis TaxID=996342 RepID=A0A1M5Y5A6_9RHOB|nr:BrnT family toxin [Marivita hallyeonensis]SHI07261.1 hypothetical protein SAMN05443551_0087 [Marivita hallyeonensis]
MKISYDPAKRAITLDMRGLDMADAEAVFEGACITFEDDRRDYGETRHITVGYLRNRMVIVAWTERDETRRIISMRKANGREQRTYGAILGGHPG